MPSPSSAAARKSGRSSSECPLTQSRGSPRSRPLPGDHRAHLRLGEALRAPAAWENGGSFRARPGAVLAGRRSARILSSDPKQPIPDTVDLGLQSDCGSCFGLCCVALPFAASADFAIDKDAGRPCPNLRTDFRCGIHTELRSGASPAAPSSTASAPGRRSPRSPSAARTGAGPGDRPADVRRLPRHAAAARTPLVPGRGADPAGGPPGPRRPAHARWRRPSASPAAAPEELTELDVAGPPGRGQRPAAAHQRTRTGRGRRAARRSGGAPTSWAPASGAPTSGAPTPRGLPHRRRPHGRRSAHGGPDRRRSAGRGPARRRPHRRPLPHPVAAQRGQGRRRHQAAGGADPPRPLVAPRSLAAGRSLTANAVGEHLQASVH